MRGSARDGCGNPFDHDVYRPALFRRLIGRLIYLHHHPGVLRSYQRLPPGGEVTVSTSELARFALSRCDTALFAVSPVIYILLWKLPQVKCEKVTGRLNHGLITLCN